MQHVPRWLKVVGLVSLIAQAGAALAALLPSRR
jgi:hypothetical protein